MPELFAQVILPLSLHDSYTYRVPDTLQLLVKPGQRVVVQFGQKRLYAALVLSISEIKPENIAIKDIQQILDTEPVVNPQNLELWKWIADYYCSTLGDIFRAALPTGLKLDSKSEIILKNTDSMESVNEKELMILAHLRKKSVYLEDLQKKLGTDFSYPALKSLLQKGLLAVEEKMEEKYRPKTEPYIKFHPSVTSDETLEIKIESLKRAKKQVDLLFHFVHKTKSFEENRLPEISKKELFSGTGFNQSLLSGLIKREILNQFEKQVSRLSDFQNEAQTSLNLLNKYQEEAFINIKNAFDTKSVVLMHGITASGKTEIYIHLIEEILQTGRQVLYLLPEIALTSQIIRRLKNVFGSRVGIYHSKLNSQERVEIWEKVLQYQSDPASGYQVVLGARSAIFLPFSNLGLIVVDEEHENSFKQFDPAPRYNARDMAIVLGSQHGAKVLLGSATPSLESYYNALTGKYALVSLMKMHAEVEQPEILLTDLRRARKRKEMHSLLTPELYNEINNALENYEQVILFQNRRGYSPYVECFECGSIPKCVNCDVSLTFHKNRNLLSCHYCGFSKPLKNSCETCGSPEIKTRGYGTEKIEDELKPLFRNAQIDRMDLDSTQTKSAFEKIIHKIETRKTDILVGTQMVTKGLDFEHVSVVGILNADNLINFPDFRAHERAFQLISQVSGRAGRKHKRGKVIVQTSQPENHLFQFIIKRDFEGYFNSQLNERKLFRYPPYFRFIKITVKHRLVETVDRASDILFKELRKNNSYYLMGPVFPLISRVQALYNKEIWLRFDRKINPEKIKKFILDAIQYTRLAPHNSNCVFNVDVDPM